MRACSPWSFRPKIAAWVLIAALGLLCFPPCEAATIHVPTDRSSIQAAINSATHGDEIIVASGTYVEAVKINGKNIILRSADPENPEIVDSTIIDKREDFREATVTFSGEETVQCVLTGLTLTGRGDGFSGQTGISGNGTLATVIKNNITGNANGGLFDCDGFVGTNRIHNNSAFQGAGLERCDGLIENNLVYNNHATSDGGGLYNCNGTVQNNVIFGNTATGPINPQFPPLGGGVWECTGTIRNCIIWGNSPDPEGSQLTDSSTPTYCCIEGWTGGGEGNLFTDPVFVDPEDVDFRLQASSYCIDSGSLIASLTTDFDGLAWGFDSTEEPRGDGSDYDIGAYEFQGTVSLNQPPAMPVNTVPADGTTEISLSPKLESSLFSDPESNDVHSASQWQLDDNPDFSSLLFDSGTDIHHLTSIRVTTSHLETTNSYYWRVRHMDKRFEWSPWSDPTSFETQETDWTYVPDDLPTIQAAIDSATKGDEIVVRPSTYFENIVIPGIDIILRSTDPEDPTIVSKTAIDANGSGTVVTLIGRETRDCLIAGFTIRNGPGGGFSGPRFNRRTRATILLNIIEENRTSDGTFPSGIRQCDGTIERNQIRRNSFGLFDCQGLIQRNRIHDNRSGGGLVACSGRIINNLIFDNRSSDGGGGLHSCHGDIINNTIWSNSGYRGDEIHTSSATIRNNILLGSIEASSTPTYSVILYFGYDGRGTGNLYTSPRFVNSAVRDFRLRPESPLIDAGGNPNDYGSVPDDFEGTPRPFDATDVLRGDRSDYDIGAFEFTGIAEPNPPPNQPVNLLPEPGAENLEFVVDLVSSDFSDPDPNDRHESTHLQFDDSNNFDSWPPRDTLLFEEFDPGIFGTSFTRFVITDEVELKPDTTYWWRVRYEDTFLNWSEWSEPTSFTTRPLGLFTVPEDFPSIQAAINFARDGDEIVVLPGTYEEPVHFMGKTIILRSTDPDDPAIVESTIILNHPVTFLGFDPETSNPTERVDAMFTGFTVTGEGHGIDGNQTWATITKNRIVGNSGIGISHCARRIEDNVVTDNGGSGMFRSGSSTRNEIARNCGDGINVSFGTVTDSHIYDNAGTGIFDAGHVLNSIIENNGGRGISGGRGAIIEGNIIRGNRGGGISSFPGTIRGNLIIDNEAGFGTGIANSNGLIEKNIIANNHASVRNAAFSECNGTIQNNLIYGNTSETLGGGLIACDGFIQNNVIAFNVSQTDSGGIGYSDAVIVNNIIWGNSASVGAQLFESSVPSYCCIQDWSGGGTENSSEDPRFVNSSEDDFSLHRDSPCIDMGKFVEGMVDDILGNLRPMYVRGAMGGDGSGFDIGPYEFFGRLNELTDITGNGAMDFLDLFQMHGHWHRFPAPELRSDVNEDNRVDVLDLEVFLGDWRRLSGP